MAFMDHPKLIQERFKKFNDHILTRQRNSPDLEDPKLQQEYKDQIESKYTDREREYLVAVAEKGMWDLPFDPSLIHNSSLSVDLTQFKAIREKKRANASKLANYRRKQAIAKQSFLSERVQMQKYGSYHKEEPFVSEYFEPQQKRGSPQLRVINKIRSGKPKGLSLIHI